MCDCETYYIASININRGKHKEVLCEKVNKQHVGSWQKKKLFSCDLFRLTRSALFRWSLSPCFGWESSRLLVMQLICNCTCICRRPAYNCHKRFSLKAFVELVIAVSAAVKCLPAHVLLSLSFAWWLKCHGTKQGNSRSWGTWFHPFERRQIKIIETTGIV